MAKQIVVNQCNEILLSKKKEITTNTGNMDEAQKKYMSKRIPKSS